MIRGTPYPVLFWVDQSGRWSGMRSYIGKPKLQDLKAIVRRNPLAWVIA